MNGLAYKTNAAEVFERLRLLITRRAQDPEFFAAFILPDASDEGVPAAVLRGLQHRVSTRSRKSGFGSGTGISASAGRLGMTAFRPPTPANSISIVRTASWAVTCVF